MSATVVCEPRLPDTSTHAPSTGWLLKSPLHTGHLWVSVVLTLGPRDSSFSLTFHQIANPSRSCQEDQLSPLFTGHSAPHSFLINTTTTL